VDVGEIESAGSKEEGHLQKVHVGDDMLKAAHDEREDWNPNANDFTGDILRQDAKGNGTADQEIGWNRLQECHSPIANWTHLGHEYSFEKGWIRSGATVELGGGVEVHSPARQRHQRAANPIPDKHQQPVE